MYLTTGGKI